MEGIGAKSNSSCLCALFIILSLFPVIVHMYSSHFMAPRSIQNTISFLRFNPKSNTYPYSNKNSKPYTFSLIKTSLKALLFAAY